MLDHHHYRLTIETWPYDSMYPQSSVHAFGMCEYANCTNTAYFCFRIQRLDLAHQKKNPSYMLCPEHAAALLADVAERIPQGALQLLRAQDEN